MGIDVPIVNAPMGGAAGGRLAAAVSRAGGLGMVGMGSSATPTLLERELRRVAGLDRPFGIGLVHWVATARPELLDVAVRARPALLCVSFGDDWSWVRRAHNAGLTAATQVADVEAAQRAVDAGVDVLVARGAEGGGRGEPRVGTLPLLTEVLDRVSVPVLAAGGIASARGLAAVLGGCRSLAGHRLRDVPGGAHLGGGARRAAGGRRCGAGDHPNLRCCAGIPLAGNDSRAGAAQRFVDRWDGHDADPDAGARDALAAAVAADDLRLAPVNAGQGVGMVTDTRSAAETIERLCSDASALLRR